MSKSSDTNPESRVECEGLRLTAADGHRFELSLCAPTEPVASLMWLPALGVAARHYRLFAEALSARGVAVFVHEWRGHGSSSQRAGRDSDWGYRELLMHDLPASVDSIGLRFPALPTIIGGHSLGGQLAACLLALRPQTAERLWLVASGSPFWRVYPRPRGWTLPLAYRFLPWLADRNGALPGRGIGFAGREARGVMRDWARIGLSGRYAGNDMATDLETALGDVRANIDAVLLADDWLAPRASLDALLAKLRPRDMRVETLDAGRLGARADHFAWMKRPDAVAAALAQGCQPAA